MNEEFKKEVSLEGVSDTMFIPLVARNYVSKRFPEYFYDEKAVEIAEKLPRKMIEENSDEYSLMASVARYYSMDKVVQAFVKKRKECNIVNIGAGLETQCDRIALKGAHYYSLDLPPAIDVRQKVLKPHEYEKFVACDVFNFKWVEDVNTNLPTLFLASGVFIYFKEKNVIELIKKLQSRFSDSELIFDITNSKGLDYANRYIEKTGQKGTKMYFSVDNAEEFVANFGNAKLIKEMPFFSDTLRMLKNKLRTKTKIYMYLADRLKRTKMLYIKL